MEYKKDTRTKNLTLRDIHVGDWVQVWSEQAERYSPPLKIIQICDDETVYLVGSDEERCTPWEEDIKNVDALRIDVDILVGFGFEKLCDNYYYSKEDTFVMAQDNQLGVMDFFYNDKYGESVSLGDIAYMHELQQALHEERNFIGDFNIEWKGLRNDRAGI